LERAFLTFSLAFILLQLPLWSSQLSFLGSGTPSRAELLICTKLQELEILYYFVLLVLQPALLSSYTPEPKRFFVKALKVEFVTIFFFSFGVIIDSKDQLKSDKLTEIYLLTKLYNPDPPGYKQN